MATTAEHFDSHDAARYTPPAELGRWQMRALIVGVVALVVALLLGLLGLLPGVEGIRHLAFAYLMSYIFWIGISLGSLGLLMVQFVAHGAWGVTIRRIVEASSRTLYLMAVLFIPIALSMGVLYHWSHEEVRATDEIIAMKQPYLHPFWFVFRAVLYFATWLTLTFFINRWSAKQDETGNPRYHRLFRNISGGGIVALALTLTFAATDWVMSLDPHWFSTIFGILFLGGYGLSAMAFTIITLSVLARFEPMKSILTPTHFHDLGKFLLAFVMLWTYFSLSQFLIIWSGNLPEEIPWYMRRMSGGWEVISTMLVLFHFAVPFVLLLTRRTKRNFRVLATIAAGLLFMRLVDAFFLVGPEATHLHAEGVAPHHGHFFHGLEILFYIAMPVGMGGLWLAFFLWQLRRMPLLPLHDPLIGRALTHGHGHGHH